MTDNYDPGNYDRFPHDRYRCQCGESAIAIGWEVEAIICDHCESVMVWEETLHDPRLYI